MKDAQIKQYGFLFITIIFIIYDLSFGHIYNIDHGLKPHHLHELVFISTLNFIYLGYYNLASIKRIIFGALFTLFLLIALKYINNVFFDSRIFVSPSKYFFLTVFTFLYTFIYGVVRNNLFNRNLILTFLFPILASFIIYFIHQTIFNNNIHGSQYIFSWVIINNLFLQLTQHTANLDQSEKN